MKANRAFPILALTLTLAACSAPTVVPSPAPQPTPTPRPAPPPPPQPVGDWRDVPITPGDWSWSEEGGRSTARFAGGLAFACDRAAGRVLLYRQGAASGDVSLTIVTQTATRSVVGSPGSLGGSGAIAVSFAASDSLLDAMAFSRGRFVVQASGLPTLYVPSWPEISRVIEDCR